MLIVAVTATPFDCPLTKNGLSTAIIATSDKAAAAALVKRVIVDTASASTLMRLLFVAAACEFDRQ